MQPSLLARPCGSEGGEADRGGEQRMGAAAGCDGGERARGGEARSESNGGGEDERWCGICLDDVGARALQQGALDCCDHLFCFPCILKWSQVPNPPRHPTRHRADHFVSRSRPRMASRYARLRRSAHRSARRPLSTAHPPAPRPALSAFFLRLPCASLKLPALVDVVLACTRRPASTSTLSPLKNPPSLPPHLPHPPKPSPPPTSLLPSPTAPQVESRCPLCKRRFTRIRRLAPPSHGRGAGGAGSGGESSEREGQAGEEGEGGAGGRRRSARAVTIRVPLRDQQGAQGAQRAQGAAMPGRGGRGLSRERGGGMGLGVGRGVGSSVVAESDDDSGWEYEEDVEDGDGEYASEEDEDEGEWSESEGEEEAEDDVEGDEGADGGSSSSVGGSEDESIAARICAGRYTPSSSSTAAAAAPARPAPAGAVGSGAASGSRKRKAGRSGGRRVKRRRTAATAGAGGGGVVRGRKRRVKVRRRRVRRKARTVAGSRRSGGSGAGRAGAFTSSALRVLAAGVAARQRQQLAQLRSNSRWAAGGAGGAAGQHGSSSAGTHGGLAAAAATGVPAAATASAAPPMRASPPSIHDIVSPALPCPPAVRRAGLLGSTHSRGGVGNANTVRGRASGAEEDERAWRQFERARMAAAALGSGAAGSVSRSAGGGGAMIEGGRGAGLVGGGTRGVRGAMGGRAGAALVPLRGEALVHGRSGSRSGKDGNSTASLCASTSAGSSLVSSALLAASRALAGKQAAAPSAKMPAVTSASAAAVAPCRSTAAPATSSSLPAMPSLSSLSSLSSPSVPSLPPAPLCPARPPTIPCAAASERRALQVNGSDALFGEQEEQRQHRADDVHGGAGLVGVWGLRRVRERRAGGSEQERMEGEWRGAVQDASEQAKQVRSTAVIVKTEKGGDERESGCGMLSNGEKMAQGGGEWRGVKVECCDGDDAAEYGGSVGNVAQGPRAAKAEEAVGSAEVGRSAWARGGEEYGVRSGRASGNTDGGSSSLVPLGQAGCGNGGGALKGATKGGKNETSGSGESKGGGGGRGGGEAKLERGTGSRSREGAREEREAVVRAVKRYLHPLYTNKTISREQFKHVARGATHLFWDRMAHAPSPPLPLAPPPSLPSLCIRATSTCQRPSPRHPCTSSVTPRSPPPSMPTCRDATTTPGTLSVPSNARSCLGPVREGHEKAAAQGKDMEGGRVREGVGGDKSNKSGSEVCPRCVDWCVRAFLPPVHG
ncbi:unnamed protein product [Closterium sp. NIES-64]|nr:unnamed protein product [Closterium sp. NIES-64]